MAETISLSIPPLHILSLSLQTQQNRQRKKKMEKNQTVIYWRLVTRASITVKTIRSCNEIFCSIKFFSRFSPPSFCCFYCLWTKQQCLTLTLQRAIIPFCYTVIYHPQKQALGFPLNWRNHKGWTEGSHCSHVPVLAYDVLANFGFMSQKKRWSRWPIDQWNNWNIIARL